MKDLHKEKKIECQSRYKIDELTLKDCGHFILRGHNLVLQRSHYLVSSPSYTIYSETR